MDDLISRQAAIDELAAMYCKSDEEGYVWIIRRDAWARIDSLPPAEPKRGKWNRLDMDTLNCNKCGATFVLNQGSEKMHFCPNCGADMREVTA